MTTVYMNDIIRVAREDLIGINKHSTKERLKEKNGKGLAFGVVVTLKEMNGKNRIEDFKKLCIMHGWIVNEIDVENQIDVYNKAEEEIKFNT